MSCPQVLCSGPVGRGLNQVPPTRDPIYFQILLGYLCVGMSTSPFTPFWRWRFVSPGSCDAQMGFLFSPCCLRLFTPEGAEPPVHRHHAVCYSGRLPHAAVSPPLEHSEHPDDGRGPLLRPAALWWTRCGRSPSPTFV